MYTYDVHIHIHAGLYNGIYCAYMYIICLFLFPFFTVRVEIFLLFHIHVFAQKRRKNGTEDRTLCFCFVLSAQPWMGLISWEHNRKAGLLHLTPLSAGSLWPGEWRRVSPFSVDYFQRFNCEWLAGSSRRRIRDKIFTKKIPCKYNVDSVTQKALNLDSYKSFAASLPLKFVTPHLKGEKGTSPPPTQLTLLCISPIHDCQNQLWVGLLFLSHSNIDQFLRAILLFYLHVCVFLSLVCYSIFLWWWWLPTLWAISFYRKLNGKFGVALVIIGTNRSINSHLPLHRDLASWEL